MAKYLHHECQVDGCIRTATTRQAHVIFTDRHMTVIIHLCDKHKGA
jgi:hypothetical protein